jgi:hypothetical protein
MNKKRICLIIGLLSVSAFGQSLNCDSTCIVPVNAVQNKARTVYGNNNGTYAQYQTLSCGTGYIGSISKVRYVVVNNGSSSVSGWTTSSNTCQAVVVPPVTPSCPPSYQGYYVINEITGELIWTCTPIQTN